MDMQNPYSDSDSALRVPAEDSMCGRCRNVGEGERWASIAAGAGLVVGGLLFARKAQPLSLVAGGALIYRGVTGYCYGYEALGVNTAEDQPATGVAAGRGVKYEQTISVKASPEKLYRFWRDVENLPRVMEHLESVTAQDDRLSHWVARGPLGAKVEWDAEIFNETENEFIAWRSLPGGNVDTAGSVHFRPLEDGRGTAVDVSLKYSPTGGKLGANLAWLMGQGAEQQIAEDLHRFKGVMEGGEAPTTSGQPHS